MDFEDKDFAESCIEKMFGNKTKLTIAKTLNTIINSINENPFTRISPPEHYQYYIQTTITSSIIFNYL